MASEAQDPLIGQVLDGRYAITRLLGSGGMGAVYEAHQRRLNRKVAIKTIHAHLASKGVVVERFRREAMAAASAGSQHIVDVYDLGVMPSGAPYMVMELIDGTDLRSLVETQGRLASSRAAHIVAQACDALEAAHEMGIIHRDVKPENIMVTQRRTDPSFVKVVDFGISKLRDSSLTGSHELLGTPYAMAPEQLRGAGHVDARCDVYGLGVCLYWALSAHVPYDADVLPLLIAQISSGQAVPLRTRVRDLPPAAYDIVATALASDPDQRFRSVRAFSAALRTLENATPSAALAATAVASPPRRPQPPPAPRRPAHQAPAAPPPHATLGLESSVGVHARDTTQRGRDALPTTFGSKLFRLVLALALLGGVGAGGWFGLQTWQRSTNTSADPDAGLAIAQSVVQIDSVDATTPVEPQNPGGERESPAGEHTPPPVRDTPTAAPPTTIAVSGLRSAEVRAGDRSCISPCSLAVAGDRRVRIGYANHWLALQLDEGEQRVLALGAARVDIEDDARVTIGPHSCRGGCTVPLPVGRHAASATWDAGAANSPFNVREGEITDVRLLRIRPAAMTMMRATGRVRFMLRDGSIQIRVGSRTCHTPCVLDLPAGEHVARATRDGRTTSHPLTIRAGETINVGYNRPIQLMRQTPRMANMATFEDL